MSERSFEDELVRAMLLVREFRLHAVAQRINPKAVRIAIKVLSAIDDHFAHKQLSAKENFDIDIYARRLSRRVIEAEEGKLKEKGS